MNYCIIAFDSLASAAPHPKSGPYNRWRHRQNQIYRHLLLVPTETAGTNEPTTQMLQLARAAFSLDQLIERLCRATVKTPPTAVLSSTHTHTRTDTRSKQR